MKKIGSFIVLLCYTAFALIAIYGCASFPAAPQPVDTDPNALTRAPKSASDYLNRGLIFATRGDFDVALLDFDEAVKLNPNMAMAYLHRGKTYLARQVKIIRIDNGFELIWRAGARNKTADDDRALADFTKAIALAPGLSATLFYRGSLYSDIREHDKAIVDFSQAIRLDPNDAKAYVARSIVYRNKGDYDRAIAGCTQAIRIDPNYAAAYYNRGIAYSDKYDDYDRAIADYNQAIRIDPNDQDARNKLENNLDSWPMVPSRDYF